MGEGKRPEYELKMGSSGAGRGWRLGAEVELRAGNWVSGQ